MGITPPDKRGDSNKTHTLIMRSALPPHDKFQSTKSFAGCKVEYGAENRK
jgi:hypothetical protein